jgi:hypothetical protein
MSQKPFYILGSTPTTDVSACLFVAVLAILKEYHAPKHASGFYQEVVDYA